MMEVVRKTYNVKEAAKVVGISVPKMYDLCHARNFPAIFLGRRIVIPMDKLHEWLETKASEGWGGVNA